MEMEIWMWSRESQYYLNPDWKAVKFRSIDPFGKDYMQDNGDYFYDVDGDGDLDVIDLHFPKYFGLKILVWRVSSGNPWNQQVGRDWLQAQRNHFLSRYEWRWNSSTLPTGWNNKNPMLIWKFKGDKLRE